MADTEAERDELRAERDRLKKSMTVAVRDITTHDDVGAAIDRLEAALAASDDEG